MSTAPDIALQLVPVTPAVAALLHQLQQEAIEANPAREPGSVVLAHSGPLRHLSPGSDAWYIRAYSEDYRSSTYLMRSRTLPGGIWTGCEERRDADGRKWTRDIQAVVDDFGDLVEVAR